MITEYMANILPSEAYLVVTVSNTTPLPGGMHDHFKCYKLSYQAFCSMNPQIFFMSTLRYEGAWKSGLTWM